MPGGGPLGFEEFLGRGRGIPLPLGTPFDTILGGGPCIDIRGIAAGGTGEPGAADGGAMASFGRVRLTVFRWCRTVYKVSMRGTLMPAS